MNFLSTNTIDGFSDLCKGLLDLLKIFPPVQSLVSHFIQFTLDCIAVASLMAVKIICKFVLMEVYISINVIHALFMKHKTCACAHKQNITVFNLFESDNPKCQIVDLLKNQAFQGLNFVNWHKSIMWVSYFNFFM